MKRLACALLILPSAFASEPADAATKVLEWKDLVPRQGSAAESNTYNVVPGLNGERVRLAGYIVPVEVAEGGKGLKRFLLVPYVGVCPHVPAPTANQVVFVTAQKPVEVESIWHPVLVAGTLSTKAMANNRGDVAGYTLSLEDVADYTGSPAQLPPAPPPVHNSPFLIDR